MADEQESREALADPGRRAVDFLMQLQPDLKAAAVLDSAGRSQAVEGTEGSWEAPARELLAEAGFGPGGEAGELHVATPKGEVFAVREGEVTLVAIAARFVLSSLLLFDMRTALRRMSGGEDAA